MSKTKPYIIAELGSNFTDFDSAKDAISIAKACGADAIKFQTYDPDDMYGNGEGGGKMDIMGWLPKLKEKADACDIDFMCTAFSVKTFNLVDDIGVKIHKIASSDINYLDLLEAAKDTGKKVLLSCGGSSFNDIKLALEVLNKPITTVMYCCSEYPSTWHNLRAINVIRDGFKCNVGYSDHSIDVFTSVMAADIYGATVIEKHFKANADMNTPDSNHSLCPDRFKYMCDLIHDTDRLDFPTRGERDMLLKHNRRLIATKDLNIGDMLEYGNNFGAYRSMVDDVKGLSPFQYKQVDGKRAGVAIAKGASIGPKDFG